MAKGDYMQTLNGVLRGQLENIIKGARDIAEVAAIAALEQLCVGAAKPDTSMSDAQMVLRCRLRAHGRQLGDILDSIKQTQEIYHLTEEVAYEYWHRMLFARFLAENNLLMFCDDDNSEMSVPINLEECNELAPEMNAKNGWELAGRLASKMLPQIFRADSPVFDMDFAPEYQKALEDLVSNISQDVFTATDSLGWIYQFWQSKRKDAVNRSEVKIGAQELPVVTQLFTEPYMVRFLLDNSLGAWWSQKKLSETDRQDASSEDELREKASLPGVSLNYLRFVRAKTECWTPAAGSFDQWPDQFSDLKVMDPCCGSGHFLVASFLMLVPMRMEYERISAQQAVDLVLSQNLHGLELDQRCVELAAFALALSAWKYPNAGGFRRLPEMNLACSGLSVGSSREDWQKLASGQHNLKIALDMMYTTFQHAPILGSLMDPTKTDAIKIVPWDELAYLLNKALTIDQSDEQHEIRVVAQGLAKAAILLSKKYNWIITNVPYLTSGKQHIDLRDFCESYYSSSKSDLATVFLERCLKLCTQGGTISLVIPQNWLFLPTYRNLRDKLLRTETWRIIAKLGPKAFETISGEVVKAILLIISRGDASLAIDQKYQNHQSIKIISGLDVSEFKSVQEKANNLIHQEVIKIEQAKQLDNPGVKVIFSNDNSGNLISDFATVNYGSKPGQTVRVTRKFWEFAVINKDKWMLMESSPEIKKTFSGKSEVCLTLAEIQKHSITSFGVRGSSAWGNTGIIVSKMSDLPFSIYCGHFFDDNTCVIIPNDSHFNGALLSYMESGVFRKAVRSLNQKLSITKETLEAVHFDLERWVHESENEYPKGLPKPYTNDPTQWVFHGHPCKNVSWNKDNKQICLGETRKDDMVLQVAIARLLGYRWPAELDTYMELSDESREAIQQCGKLDSYADKEGIVCIPAVHGERSASDRIIDILATSFGSEWSSNTLSEILAASGWAEKSLESWLRDGFFTQHNKIFQNRPFIWHVWDGQSDGFSVLINYHKLDKNMLQILIYSYLEDWIKMQKEQVDQNIDGAEDRFAAAKELQNRLIQIFEGESPLDVFVRWKSIAQQPVGWDPDLNDGVRLNIRPWMTVNDIKKKGAGVLRDKPNIKWDKDRGKDLETDPWYSVFGGDRINDYHLTLKEKQTARCLAKDGGMSFECD